MRFRPDDLDVTEEPLLRGGSTYARDGGAINSAQRDWNGLREDAVDLGLGSFVYRPSHHHVDRLELLGWRGPRAPWRCPDRASTAPPNGSRAFRSAPAPSDRAAQPQQDIEQSGAAEFGIVEAKIVAHKFCVGAHLA